MFPIDGADVMMGNEGKKTGGKIFPVPEVVVSTILEPYDLAKRHPGVFGANVITQAQSVTQAQDTDLCDSLFGMV